MKIYPDDWRERLFTSIVIIVFMAAAMMLMRTIGFEYGIWPIMIAVVLAIIVGNLLGRMLFHRSGSGTPDRRRDA